MTKELKLNSKLVEITFRNCLYIGNIIIRRGDEIQFFRF